MDSYKGLELLPLIIFAVDIKSGNVVYVNPKALEHGIHTRMDATRLIIEQEIWHACNSTSLRTATLTIQNRILRVSLYVSDIEIEDRPAKLLTVVSFEDESLPNESDVTAQLCALFTDPGSGAKGTQRIIGSVRDRQRVREYLRITAQSVGAFSGALYEKSNGRYVLRDEWRSKKCVCVPVLGADVEDTTLSEAMRLARLKRCEDAELAAFVKPYGTQGMFAYFFDQIVDDVRRARIRKFAALYQALSPDTAKNDYLGIITRGLDALSQGVSIWDMESRKLLYANRAFRNVFGLGGIKLRLDKLEKDARVGKRAVSEYTDESGRVFGITHTVTRVGRRGLIATSTMDVTRYKQAENRLETLAGTDVLTGIKNRRAGLDILEEMYNKCRKANRPLTVCFADIDGLKRINDTYGHGAGDNMIRVVSGMLKKYSERIGTVYRLGGDEFVMILPGYDKEKAMLLAAQIEAAVDKCFLDKTQSVTVSFGFKEAEYSPEETSATLISVADYDMYRKKNRKA